MHKTYGKLVDSLLTKTGKSWVRLSTYTRKLGTYAEQVGVKAPLIPTFLPNFYAHISPAYFTPPPLVEYIFYPVSTAPITNNTKEKIKER